ncbi:MAG: hypothetical protein JWM27_4794 [Gemmatimonadetes bacterium]|nr:hypothetical protein [Gemmatimonadota bacterium]
MHFRRPTLLIALAFSAGLAPSPAAAQHVWKPAQPPPPARGTAAPAAPPQQPEHPRHRERRDYAQTPELPNCQVVLSGAVSGVYGCGFVQASAEGNGWSRVRIASNPAEQVLNRPEVQVDVGFPGAPAAGAVHTAADASRGSTVWVRYDGAVWGFDAGRGGVSDGTYELRLSRASDAGAMGFGRSYAVGGTLSADLPVWGGASTGAVHVEIRF